MKKIYLIDGMSLVFRAYHALFNSGLKSPNGEPTSAVFAFSNIITSLLEKEKPEYLGVVFDTAAPTFRHIKFPLYKANRVEFPEDLVPQLLRIKELLTYLSIPQFELPGYEADDIIGTIITICEKNENQVICLTNDKDYYQLVSGYVTLYKPSKTEDFDKIGIQGVFDKFGVTPQQVIDVLALIGDTSDNIPGVKGIGEKTAIPLIQKYQTIENIYENIEQITPISVKDKLVKDKENALLAKYLVTIDRNVPINFEIDQLELKNPDFDKLDNFFAQLNFRTLRKKWNEKAIAGLSKNDSSDVIKVESSDPSSEDRKSVV